LDSSEGTSLFAQLGVLNASKGVTIFALPGTDPTSLYFNFGANSTKANPWVNNTLVREAFSYALNKTALVSSVFYGFAQVNWAPLAPENYAYDYNLTQYSYNVTKANALLDRAGYPRGADGTRFTATMAVPIGNDEELV